MDEQTRGSEMPRSTLRKFMNDPKSSVMSYLAENMAAQQIQQHIQQQNHGQNSSQQSNQAYGQQYQNQGSNGLSSQFQNHNNASQTSLTPSHSTQNNGGFQSASPQPGQVQNSQLPSISPYLASNMGNLLNQNPEGQSGEEGVNGKMQQQDSNLLTQQQNMQNQASDFLTKNLGKPPPTSGLKHNSSPHSAPRLYHRMNLDFEATKSTFFTARAQHNPQEMTSAAYDLESLSRRIWSLRFEHAWEFEGYEETGHRAAIAHWQSQYEFWADTVLDIQEGDSAASMFAVHRTSSTGASALGANASDNPILPQVGGASLPGPYSQPPQPSYQEMDPNLANQAPVQPQQSFPNQTSMMDQKIPVNQGLQNNPPPQYLPPSSLPGGLPVSSPPASVNPIQPSLPFQQQSMTPPPQQTGPGQIVSMQGQNRPPPIAQNGPPIMGGEAQSNQNLPQNNQPNMQRGPFQQVPPPQPGQQFQSGPTPTGQQTQYGPYTAQRPPSRPNNANLPPQGPMSQMSLGQSQPLRPEGFPQQAPAGGR